MPDVFQRCTSRWLQNGRDPYGHPTSTQHDCTKREGHDRACRCVCGMPHPSEPWPTLTSAPGSWGYELAHEPSEPDHTDGSQ